MPSSDWPKVPGLKPPDLPAPDLGLPLRYSKKANETVGEAMRGSYALGAVDGFSIGQTIGQSEGRLEGIAEGSVLTAVIFGLIFFCAALVMRLARK